MHRPGCDPDAMEPQDFLCDCCGSTYRDDRPMVEGHRGSLICGHCLRAAYEQVVVRNAGATVPEHVACALCLLNKSGDYWQSPARVEIVGSEICVEPEPGVAVCAWCIKRSATLLAKDASAGWTLPA